jgi:cytidyltransferase-like protein
MPGDERLDPWPCVVGRFQPFHRDHLSLVQQAAAEGGRVIVAVTNVEAAWRVAVPAAAHRHLDEANPFTYWQRVEMVLAATHGLVAPEQIRITPFPIHDPSEWDAYLPAATECWVRDRGPWEQHKIRLLASRYAVRVPDSVTEEVTGSDIRRRLAAGDETWRDAVPSTVAELIERWQRAPQRVPPGRTGGLDGDVWRRPAWATTGDPQ